jgi:spore coat polysaccharide biosynthesis protein SpsF (cytidylyltransferase family)/aryl-alcohol dehydrogenase-like predicted oxidoreductase
MREPYILIQGRLSSSRLPGKSLLPIVAMPALVLCARRAMNRGGNVLVATSSHSSDDALVQALEKHRIPVMRGSLDDVLSRFEAATRELADNDTVVRLTGDNMLPDGDFVQLLAKEFEARGTRYLGTSSPRDGLPYGLSAEIFHAGALREAHRDATAVYDREHVTPWIRRKYGAEIFHPAELAGDFSHLRCTLDDFDDYVRLLKLFETVTDPLQISWLDLVRKLSGSPDEPRSRVPFHIKNGAVHSELAIGGVQFGMKYGAANVSGMPTQTAVQEMIRTAIDNGVTAIDTARAYVESETRIGETLSRSREGRVTVITKLDPMPHLSDEASPSAVRDAVDASVFRSCRELRTHCLHTLLLHRWAHRHQYGGALWKRLLELRDQGVIQNLGASVYRPSEALEALSDVDIKHIQVPFNVLDWRWKAACVPRACLDRPDVVLHGRSAFLQGILINGPEFWPRLQHGSPSEWLQKLDGLVSELGRKNVQDLCVAYVRAQTWLTAIVIGSETVEQLRENINFFQALKLSSAECARVDEVLAGADEKLLDPSQWSRTN